MNKLDVLSYINPQMKAVLAKENALAADTTDTSVGFQQMRKNYIAGRQFWTQNGPSLHRITDGKIDSEHGTISVRYYYPTDQQQIPAIIYAHGGGFVLGNPETHDRITRILAEKTGAVVVSVDYSLSPEAKFPLAVQEIAAVALYLHQHGAKHGIDAHRLAFAGDSAGANLSLAAAMYLREEKHDNAYITCLLLYYGWFGLLDSPSRRLLGGSWDGLTENDWKFYMNLYAKDLNELATSPCANCFLNDMSHDMPACYIAAAEFDPLRDDSQTLAAILKEHGVPHRYELFSGVIHAFLHYTLMLDEANDALQHGATFYRQQLGLQPII